MRDPIITRFGLPLAIAILAVPALAQTAEERIEALEKRLEELELRLKEKDAPAKPVEPPNAAASLVAGPGASVGAGPGGFTIKSNDGNYSLKIGADLQVDSRTFTGNGSSSLTDQFLLRRVRPTFSGTVYKYVDYYIRPDFGQGTTVHLRCLGGTEIFQPLPAARG